MLIVAALLVFVAVSAASDAPEADPYTSFSEHVFATTGLAVEGSPSCGGSSLRIYTRGAAPDIGGVGSNESATNLADEAKSWCKDEARENIIAAAVFFGLAAFLVTLVFETWRRRRRREHPPSPRQSARERPGLFAPHQVGP